MKYIRTKNGVYDVLDYLYKNGTACSEILEKQKIAEADTIEELCDEFRQLLPKYKGNDIIGYEPEKWEYSVNDKKFYNDIGEYCYVEDFIIMGYTVYGAIWTSKGLIYVAKMNEKGELVLI